MADDDEYSISRGMDSHRNSSPDDLLDERRKYSGCYYEIMEGRNRGRRKRGYCDEEIKWFVFIPKAGKKVQYDDDCFWGYCDEHKQWGLKDVRQRCGKRLKLLTKKEADDIWLLKRI